jgi:hypothetical protein
MIITSRTLELVDRRMMLEGQWLAPTVLIGNPIAHISALPHKGQRIIRQAERFLG